LTARSLTAPNRIVPCRSSRVGQYRSGEFLAFDLLVLLLMQLQEARLSFFPDRLCRHEVVTLAALPFVAVSLRLDLSPIQAAELDGRREEVEAGLRQVRGGEKRRPPYRLQPWL
jgi:hypothetical protein